MKFLTHNKRINYFQYSIVALRRGLAPIVAIILGGALACGDLARSGIETAGILLVISHRSSGRPRYRQDRKFPLRNFHLRS